MVCNSATYFRIAAARPAGEMLDNNVATLLVQFQALPSQLHYGYHLVRQLISTLRSLRNETPDTSGEDGARERGGEDGADLSRLSEIAVSRGQSLGRQRETKRGRINE